MTLQARRPFQPMADLLHVISASMVVLDLYAGAYLYLRANHYTWPVTDRLLAGIAKTGLFANELRPKAIAILFLLLASLTHAGRNDKPISLGKALLWLDLALVLFFWGGLPFCEKGVFGNSQAGYTIVTITGYLLCMFCASNVSKAIWTGIADKDPFGKGRAGFPQEERKVGSEFSLHLRGRFTYEGKTGTTWLNLINPRRSVLVLGGPGCGKTWYIIEPLLKQLIEKGVALFVFDLKYDTLSRKVRHYFASNKDRYPPGASYYEINFSDACRSHRCNVLEPSTLQWTSDATGAAKTILLSLNKTWVHKQGEFFVESPINFLGALIWWLKKFRNGAYCTLPHAIELAQQPYDKLFSILAGEPEIRPLISSLIENYKKKAVEVLESQLASAKVPLGRLASPDIYYILTGNDFSLVINDPKAPKVFCLGGDTSRQEALQPILSLYIDRLCQVCNKPGQYPCAIVCDEFGMVRAYNIRNTISSARSNQVITILAMQDISQMRILYSRDETDVMMNIAGNLLCGQVGGTTAQWVAERFPKVRKEHVSTSTNSADTSVTRSLQWEPAVTAATISTLSSGEFVGVLADDPDTPLELKTFHAKLDRPERESGPYGELPEIKEVSREEIEANFRRVQEEVRSFVGEEVKRMMQDPDMREWVVQGVIYFFTTFFQV